MPKPTLKRAYDMASTEIKEALINAEIQDALTLTPQQIKAAKGPLFWEQTIREPSDTEKEIVVTWNLISAPELGRADDQVAIREVYVAIDLFVRRAETDTKIRDLIGKIEDELFKLGWELTLEQSSYYNTQTQQIHYAYAAVKTLK